MIISQPTDTTCSGHRLPDSAQSSHVLNCSKGIRSMYRVFDRYRSGQHFSCSFICISTGRAMYADVRAVPSPLITNNHISLNQLEDGIWPIQILGRVDVFWCSTARSREVWLVTKGEMACFTLT